jgi:hypothetical protein
MNRQDSMSFIFSSFFSLKRRKIPSRTSLPGGRMEYGPGVQGNFALPGRRQRQVTTRPCRKEINDKAKCPSLSNQIFYIQGYFP